MSKAIVSIEDILKNVPTETRLHEIERRTRVKNKVVDKLLERYYTEYYDENPQLYMYKDLDNEILPIVEKSYRNGLYMLVTINIDPQKSPTQKDLLKFINKKPFAYIRRWCAVVEYHTLTSNHLHIHMLIEKHRDEQHYTKATQKTVINDFFRRWKCYVADTHKIDVRIKRNPESSIKYINGQKKEDNKRALVDLDRQWREQNGIPHKFGNWDEIGDATPLVSTPIPPSFSAELLAQLPVVTRPSIEIQKEDRVPIDGVKEI